MLQNLPKETSVISTTWHAWEHKESKHCGGKLEIWHACETCYGNKSYFQHQVVKMHNPILFYIYHYLDIEPEKGME